jgi:hypothetical protein
MYPEPLPTVLRIVPLGRDGWILVLGLAFVPAVVGQGLKVLRASLPHR